MEYSKKTALGYKTVPTPSECTHVIMTWDEYMDMKTEINSAKNAQKTAEVEAANSIRRVQESAAIQITDYNKKANDVIKAEKEKAAASVKAAEASVEKIKKEVEQERKLNENLRRIATERANKARNMDKHDPGYRILSWQPFPYKRIIRNGRKTEEKRYNLYKITIQTPWDCSLPEDQIDRLVMESVKKGELTIESGTKYQWYTQNVGLDLALDGLGENEHLVLNRQYRANGKEALWEATFVTTFEPSIVEKHRFKYV